MDVVQVALGARSYEVRIGPGLIARAGAEIAPLLARPRVAVLTDETVAGLHLAALRDGLAASRDRRCRRWPCRRARRPRAGRELTRAVEWLLAEKVERRDVVVAFGGGVIGDLAGFAAAVLRRGVRFVQIPTTLLAQVDSSVGGKTGINSAHGKNLIGAFHQPSLVLADIGGARNPAAARFPGRLRRGGEIRAAGRCRLLRLAGGERAGAGAATAGCAQRAVRRSVEMKAEIVARDETEQGERALLNLGHTFCHALEAATGYSDRLLHGEGVAIGCALAFELSASGWGCARRRRRAGCARICGRWG